jgi:iron complex outermembrane receptor protein
MVTKRRYENYSDFGGTTNYKLASRYKLTDNVNILEQFLQDLEHLHYTKSTLFYRYSNLGGVPFEVGTFNNDSPAAKY